MKRAPHLLKPAEVSFADVRVFRVSAGAVAAIALCMGTIVVACIGIGWHGGILLGKHGTIPALLAWWVAFWLGLFFVFYANDWRKTLSPGAWLAVAAADGAYIKYRSYRNVSWGSNDPQVVFVPYATIARAHIDRRTWLTPETQTRATRTERCTYVELELVGVDLTELTQRLADERAGKPGRPTHGTKIWRRSGATFQSAWSPATSCVSNGERARVQPPSRSAWQRMESRSRYRSRPPPPCARTRLRSEFRSSRAGAM